MGLKIIVMKRIGYALFISALLLSTCRKQYHYATVTIDSISYLTHTSAIANCSAVNDGGVLIVEKGVCWSEKSPATIQDNHSDRGIQGTGNYKSPLFDLKPGTKYYVRAYAKNLAGISYSNEIQITTLTPEFLTDTRDNKKYPVVKIGEQYWMAVNLNFCTQNGSWFYNNDSIGFYHFGRLYNWETAKNICPDGWRLPNNKDWNELFQFINSSAIFKNACEDLNAFKLKMPGTTLWEYEYDSVNNETGFSAVAAGTYDNNTMTFNNNRMNSVFWSFDQFDADRAWFYRLNAFNNNICANYGNKGAGLSVRCIKNR